MRFVGTCLQAQGRDIEIMTQSAQPITRHVFLRNVDREELRRIELDLGYGRDGVPSMLKDPRVGYAKSTYRGKPCVYFVWSRIEHIFT